jgi:hypothetical protein
MAYPGDDDRILEQGRVGEYVGLRIQPRQPPGEVAFAESPLFTNQERNSHHDRTHTTTSTTGRPARAGRHALKDSVPMPHCTPKGAVAWNVGYTSRRSFDNGKGYGAVGFGARRAVSCWEQRSMRGHA